MKHRKYGKAALVAGVLALSMCLTGCYIPPDEISNGTHDMSVGSNSNPFDTVPMATNTSTPSPTPTDTPTGGVINNVWGNTDWSTGVSTTAGIAPTTGSPATTRPGVIDVYTSKPTDTPTPTKTPTPTALRVGSTGSEVREVQQLLKKLGYYSGSVDGDFGENTQNAVIAFQKQNGLTADGKVGTQTLTRLRSNTAATAPRATATPTPTARPTATPHYDDDTYLQNGSSGSDVRQLQNRLISLGWLDGSADGFFGGATEYAVKAFQSRAGLYNDGVAGPDTLKKVYSSNAASTSTSVSSIGESLKKGMESAAVRALQRRLKELDYLTGSVDGSFGEATESAVIAFQRQNGLTYDGVAGTATLNKLYSESAKPYSGSSAPSTPGSNPGGSNSNGNGSNSNDTSDITSTGYITLREGDKNDAVMTLQRRLKNLGYYNGYVDGTYGSGTTAAVRAYQADKNLKADGIAGPATQRALFGTSSTQTYATLRLYDEGSGVKNLQYTLYELGFYDDRVDGIYGDTTADAVRAFQIANKIEPVDGIAGNKTLQTLYSADPVSATDTKSEYTTLRPGDRGNKVVELQERLRKLGYLASITGTYDSATETAVRNFQLYNGLTTDGIAGSQTQQKLYSNNAKANPNR